MSKTYNWGIIGLGRIAHQFAQGLSVLSNAKLYAVASRSQDKADEFAQQYGATKAYNTYEALASDPDVDVVYIATPHNLHCTNTLLCLDAKKAVLCEKPLAINAVEAAQMIQKAHEQQTFLMEAIWTRYLPFCQKMMELIEADVIGDIHLVRADFGFYRPFDPDSRLFNPELAGGSLLDIGIYPLFLASLLLGFPTTIQAIAQMSETQIDQHCAMQLKYEKGQIASLFSSIQANTQNIAEIHGTKGIIRISPHFHQATHFSLQLHNEEPQDFHFQHTPGNGYTFEAKAVMNYLEADKTESDLLPLEFSKRLIQTMDAIRSQCGVVYPIDKT
ncbi:MAG: Gfo/Idh/MocA family oxidoreductase [Chitinophagales bacterium]